MSYASVAVIRCADYGADEVSTAVLRQFEFFGGLDKFVSRGDSVLIKPNFITPRSRRHAAQTDPAVLLATAKILKDFGTRPFIGDSPAWGNIFACVKALKLEEPLKKLSIPVRQLDAPKKCKIGKGDTRIGISSVALDADVIINIPKLKTHQQLTATFAVKNMFGCVSGKHKALWHFRKGRNVDEFCEMLVDIYRFLGPVLTIIDGVRVMDGRGPISGRARPLGWIIGGTDPVACELVCCRLVNIDPQTLPIIKTARQLGFGCCDLEKVELLGDDFSNEICTDFELPLLVPVRFSLPHVFRSVCKQVVFLAGIAVRSPNGFARGLKKPSDG